ncbi:MAG TPA: IS1380 family transposase [Thermoanaerobaculia bacterium]|nr:IS1380 family transposase [Thermoanaerobaculia bacterium]
MQSESTKRTDQGVTVEYTSKPVSGWGGIVTFARFIQGLGIREVLGRALPDGRTSNNQRGVVDMALQLMVSVLMGGKRFEHVERIREDQVVRVAVGAKRFASASSLTRYLGNFLPRHGEHLQEQLTQVLFGLLGSRSDVLDLDSTVFIRYGKQEGSARGYNPQKRKLLSHHPLLAMLAKSKVIVHAWLRAGSASTHRGAQEFLRELVSQLPEGFRIEALRADSGFYSRAFLSVLEELGIPYVLATKMVRGFDSWCASRTDWQRVSANIEVTEALYESPKQLRVFRRMVIIRKAIRREKDGMLFEIIDYEYQAFVTSMTLDAVEVWRFYRKRGDCENRIKELKYDFGADAFCLQSFAGTEATFRLIVFTFNLMAIFKTTILLDSKTTLGTIRHKIFVIGASVGSSGRKTILRLGLKGRWRNEFAKLLERLSLWATSTAAQLVRALTNQGAQVASPWKLRVNPMLLLIPN